jgi:hypothetical protein
MSFDELTGTWVKLRISATIQVTLNTIQSLTTNDTSVIESIPVTNICIVLPGYIDDMSIFHAYDTCEITHMGIDFHLSTIFNNFVDKAICYLHNGIKFDNLLYNRIVTHIRDIVCDLFKKITIDLGGGIHENKYPTINIPNSGYDFIHWICTGRVTIARFSVISFNLHIK